MMIMPDTSVLVPSYLANHVNHARVMPWIQRILGGSDSGLLAAHTLAETYSTLTRMPPPNRLTPAVAWQVITNDLSYFTLVTLTEAEVVAVVRDLAARQIAGGPVYDALIAAVARKANADLLLTFNTAHFLRVAPDLASRIKEP